MIRLCSLWKNTSTNGDNYYRGSLSPGLDIVVLKNKNKDTPNKPDWVLYIKVKLKREGESDPMDAWTGLWKHDRYLQGKTKDGAVIQIHMQKKNEEKHPDAAVFIAEAKKEAGGFE